MDRDTINQMVAQAAGGVDAKTTEQVLEGLEQVILAQMGQGGGHKFTKVIALYQTWKGGK